jgi:hypothetical protein
MNRKQFLQEIPSMESYRRLGLLFFIWLGITAGG